MFIQYDVIFEISSNHGTIRTQLDPFWYLVSDKYKRTKVEEPKPKSDKGKRTKVEEPKPKSGKGKRKKVEEPKPKSDKGKRTKVG